MQTLGELIHGSAELLKSNDIIKTSFAKPFYPTCVVYFGKRSALYHDELHADISQGWGGNADYIEYLTVLCSDKPEFIGTQDGAEVPVNGVKARMTKLLSAQTVFNDMSRLSLFCVLDTTFITSADEFEGWYKAILSVKDVVGIPVLSMLMVVLNESLQNTGIAGEIKRTVLRIYRDADLGGYKNHIYDSVFIFGNRLRNGSFISLDPSDSAYACNNILADIVLLSNSCARDYNDRRSRLYGGDKPALTAAYGSVQKPITEITIITLNIILNRLKELVPAQSIDAGTLSAALGIDNGRSEVCERFYSQLKGLLPSEDFMEWLPGKANSGRSFEEFNRSTDGCLQAFLEQNHFGIVSSELFSRNDMLRNEIRSLLVQSLNAAQLKDGIPSGVRETAYDKAEIAFNASDKLTVSSAVEMKVKKEIARGIRKKNDEAVDSVVERARLCIRCFKDICTELDRMYAIGEDGTRKNLTSFYGLRIQRYLNDQSKVTNLFKRMFRIDNDRDAMLRILLDAVSAISDSDPVFRLSFTEELTERLKNVDTESKAQEFIGQELIKSLDEKVSFYSMHVFRSRMYEAYFLNTEGTNNGLLYKYLIDRDIPPEVKRTFFNSCNNDTAQSIWFYVCSEDNLSL